MVESNMRYNEKFDIGLVLRQIQNVKDMKIDGEIAKKLKGLQDTKEHMEDLDNE